MKLYPLIESRDSYNPDKGMEPSFAVSDINIELDDSNASSGDSSIAIATKANKELFVPTKTKNPKENAKNLLKEVVSTFNSFASQNPTKDLIAYFKEESRENRKYDMELARMQMEIWKTILMPPMGQQENAHQPQQRPPFTQAAMTSTKPIIHNPRNNFHFGNAKASSFQAASFQVE